MFLEETWKGFDLGKKEGKLEGKKVSLPLKIQNPKKYIQSNVSWAIRCLKKVNMYLVPNLLYFLTIESVLLISLLSYLEETSKSVNFTED